MPDINMANRQVCDVDIRDYKTKKPIIVIDTANTTTAGLTSDNVYAMAKGSRRIAFNNPLEGTMSIELQVYNFKTFSLFSDGAVDGSAVYAETKTIKATTAGTLSITPEGSGTIQAGTVFVYPVASYGDDTAVIAGTFASGTFTATTASNIAVGSEYKVAYMVSRSANVTKVAFNNKKLPKDYFITMSTLDKTEDGTYSPFLITTYKATIQRNFELSFSSEGDPASITINFDLCEDADGNVLDITELESTN